MRVKAHFIFYVSDQAASTVFILRFSISSSPKAQFYLIDDEPGGDRNRALLAGAREIILLERRDFGGTGSSIPTATLTHLQKSQARYVGLKYLSRI
ncbi:hypothetical protein BH20ACI2_BH20ACI2_21070 [soil metagenome]